MLVHDLKLIHGESRAGRELHDVLRRRHLPARKYLLSDEPHEPQITHSDRDTVLGPIARWMGEYRLQYHAAIVGQDSVGHVEERRVPRFTERLESFNADYAVDGLIELLPPSQEYPVPAVGVDLLQKSLAVGALVFTQRQADDVDVVFLDRTFHGRSRKQRHAGLQAQLVERAVDLGHLGFFKGHVVALEERAATGPRWVLKQPEEIIGDVVVGLNLLEVWPHVRRARAALSHLRLTSPGGLHSDRRPLI